MLSEKEILYYIKLYITINNYIDIFIYFQTAFKTHLNCKLNKLYELEIMSVRPKRSEHRSVQKLNSNREVQGVLFLNIWYL